MRIEKETSRQGVTLADSITDKKRSYGTAGEIMIQEQTNSSAKAATQLADLVNSFHSQE